MIDFNTDFKAKVSWEELVKTNKQTMERPVRSIQTGGGSKTNKHTNTWEVGEKTSALTNRSRSGAKQTNK